MKVKLVGYRALDFKDKDGSSVQGVSLFVVYPDSDVEGLRCDNVFIRKESGALNIDPNAFLNKEISLEVNLKGKVSAVTAL